MRKQRFVYILYFIFCFQSIKAQKIINLTVELDSSIDSKKIYCMFYNGKSNTKIIDSFINNKINLNLSFYTPYASISIRYTKGISEEYSQEFFITNKYAKIFLQLKEDNNANPFFAKENINAVNTIDTSVNTFFKKLVLYRNKESQEVSNFWKKHGDNFFSSDSLMQINKELFKVLNIKTVEFLKQHSQNYFAFWYFRTQVLSTSIAFLNKDTIYLNWLLSSLKSFPKKFIQSDEGNDMVKNISGMLDKPKINSSSPPFKIKDINNISTSLGDYKGKYILIDFWATWCAPCMRELPFIKKLRYDYPPEKLVIIGINKDKNISTLKEAIQNESLNWTHYFDVNNKIIHLFGVLAFPTTILINDKGVIVYNSSVKDDKEQLIKLLEKIN